MYHRKYYKLRDEDYSSALVSRRDRPSRRSLYHSNQKDPFQYTYSLSPSSDKKDDNVPRTNHSSVRHQGERREMIEYLSYGDQTECRDNDSAERYHLNRRDSPPIENIEYQANLPNERPEQHAYLVDSAMRYHQTQRDSPPMEQSEHQAHLPNNHLKGHVYPSPHLNDEPRREASSRHFYHYHRTKGAEYLPCHENSFKRAEILSYPNNHRRFEHTRPWKDIQYTPRIATEDSVSSPPRVHRHGISRHHKHREFSERTDNQIRAMDFPIQTRHYHCNHPKSNIRPPIDFRMFGYERIGHPSLGIHRLRLPDELLRSIDDIVHGCEKHAQTLEDGWCTDLYSLTKQDIALIEIPTIYHMARPIVNFMKDAASQLYSIGKGTIQIDKNQPHVVKYSGQHQGVELHHDKCDITMNVMLSRSSEYQGGGTYFRDANRNVRLGFGEFLLHPGDAIHAGSNISGGTRFLMVIFANSSARIKLC